MNLTLGGRGGGGGGGEGEKKIGSWRVGELLDLRFILLTLNISPPQPPKVIPNKG